MAVFIDTNIAKLPKKLLNERYTLSNVALITAFYGTSLSCKTRA